MRSYRLGSWVFFVVAILGFLMGYSFNYNSSASQKMKNLKKSGFAVVELFTSEGCSSCPPADKAVADLLAKKFENVYILSFHVDYWNRLGWIDPFSQSLFSARQRKYATIFSLNSVYTPQVIVNGGSEFVGSNENRLHATIQNELSKAAQSDIHINTKRTDNTVTVTYTTTNQNKDVLHLAVVQSQATTVVKKGENAGRNLHHVNIVRALHTFDIKQNGSLTIEIPKELASVALQLIAYTQSRESLKILGADQKDL